MNIQEEISKLSDETLINATKELKLRIIPDDAIIRKLSLKFYETDDVMHMTTMLSGELAIELGKRLEIKK